MHKKPREHLSVEKRKSLMELSTCLKRRQAFKYSWMSRGKSTEMKRKLTDFRIVHDIYFILKRCLLLFRKRLQYRVKATKDVQTLGHISPRYSEVLAQNQEKCDLSHN